MPPSAEDHLAVLRERRDWLFILLSAKLRAGDLQVRAERRELEALTWAISELEKG